MDKLKTVIYISLICLVAIIYKGEMVKLEINETRPKCEHSEQIPPEPLPYYEIEIITTAYSEYDSCHYEDCVMASGKPAYVGAIATNFLPLGTKVEIEGEIYIVEDRHSKRLEDRIDIFQGYGDKAYHDAVHYGKQIKRVKIYY